jgi:undecaprenyl-diphosphatase
MLAATRLGDGWLWYGMAAAVLLFGGPLRFAAVAAGATAGVAGVALFLTMKRLASRKRPCAIEPHCWATLLPPDQFSFPSGHAITAFAMTVTVAQFYPHLFPPVLFCACSIAASRVVLGLHFLSDVLVGVAVGSGLGYGAALLFR